MDANVQNRINESIKRVNAEKPIAVTITTAEDAEKYGVRLGDTINIYPTPKVIGNAQQGWDDLITRLFYHELTNVSER